MALSNYYGGRTLPEVADVVRGLEQKSMKSCVSLLPRLQLRPRGIEAERDKYLDILPFLRTRGLNADLTVKLSQFGERWHFADCIEALAMIAGQAAEHGAFVWVDQEQSSLVDLTLEAFECVARSHENVGICLQTYLRRTERDLAELTKNRHPVRLVKGYYRERPPTAFRTWLETTENFAALLPRLMEGSRRPAIGTHDPWLLYEARRAESRARVPVSAGGEPGPAPRPLEYQFFLGARPELAEELAYEGRPVRVYIPYGPLLPYLLHSLPYMDISRNVQRVLGFKTIH